MTEGHHPSLAKSSAMPIILSAQNANKAKTVVQVKMESYLL